MDAKGCGGHRHTNQEIVEVSEKCRLYSKGCVGHRRTNQEILGVSDMAKCKDYIVKAVADISIQTKKYWGCQRSAKKKDYIEYDTKY